MFGRRVVFDPAAFRTRTHAATHSDACAHSHAADFFTAPPGLFSTFTLAASGRIRWPRGAPHRYRKIGGNRIEIERTANEIAKRDDKIVGVDGRLATNSRAARPARRNAASRTLAARHLADEATRLRSGCQPTDMGAAHIALR
jgi:hypothetical protein